MDADAGIREEVLGAWAAG
uniref:Uncharacterized protein n=1 Tax=Arundo donax TaxID=35708 RepID=A0A0A9HPV3_ARUDO